MKKLNKIITASSILGIGLSMSTHAAITSVFTDDFTGGNGLLNGETTTTGGGVWDANTIATQDGVTGAGEGSALLSFNPVAGETYTMSLDVNHSGGSAWVGLGFARDALGALGASSTSERFTNNPEGISWLLYRDGTTVADDIQIFGGLRTGSGIADNDASAYVSGVSQTLSIVIETAADGGSFTADYFVEGSSLLTGGPVTIVRNIDDLNYAGFTVDGSGAIHTVDNFSLTSGIADPIPEPSSSALLGLGGLALILRRRK